MRRLDLTEPNTQKKQLIAERHQAQNLLREALADLSALRKGATITGMTPEEKIIRAIWLLDEATCSELRVRDAQGGREVNEQTTPASCLACGEVAERGAWDSLHPEIYVCMPCRNVAQGAALERRTIAEARFQEKKRMVEPPDQHSDVVPDREGV